MATDPGSKKEKKQRVNSDEIEPLDAMAVQAIGRDGKSKIVPALNVGFMEPRQYVHYKALPYLFLPISKNVNTARIEEWLERTYFLEEDLLWLLRLPYNRFWSQVIHDEGVHLCLQSYLSNAPRDYDLNPSVPEEVLSREKSLNKLVFLVMLRMSTHKESKMNHLTPRAFGEIVYDNFVFDIPRMMDICALYWFRNHAIISKMIENLFAQQPSYFSDLEEAVPCLLMAFDSVEERLGLRDDKHGTPQRIEDVDTSELSSFHIHELLDIINYMTDVSATLFTFLEAYPDAGPLFTKHNLTSRIPSFYDSVFLLLEKEVRSRTDLPEYENCLSLMSKKLILAKSFLLRLFRNLVATTCIQPLLESKCSETSLTDNAEAFHLDSYLQTFMEISTEKLFLCHYNYLFPIQTDLDVFSDAGIALDSASVKYILSSIEPFHVQNTEEMEHQVNGFIPEKEGLSVRPKTKTKNIVKDNGNGTLSQKSSGSLSEGATASPRPDEAELVSLIHAVKDIIPELGDRFVKECLEYYNFDSEKTVDAILCCNLPPHLENADRMVGSKKSEDIVMQPPKPAPSLLDERRGIFDYDEFDVFNREDVPMDRIHKGKSNKTPGTYNSLANDKTSSTLKQLILQCEERFEDEEQRLRELNLYDDEYDDTYDSLSVNLIEAQPENELIRPFTVPVVLKQMKKSGQQVAEEEEESDSAENEVEEGKPEPPRDSFCENPEDIRRRAEQRYHTKLRNKGIDPDRQRPSNYQNKEKNKGKIGNHNRRSQADFKRSRGMGGFPTR